jgi:hypothetical protein
MEPRTTLSRRKSAISDAGAPREAERFEALVGELSAAMAQVPADAVDSEIQKWLDKVRPRTSQVTMRLEEPSGHGNKVPSFSMVPRSHISQMKKQRL